MTSEALAELLGRHLEAENARRMDDTLATLTEDCVFDDRALGRVFLGRDGARDYYRIWWDAFAPTVTPEQLYWRDDGGIVAETRFRGVHSGPYLGIEPTGREIDVPVVILAHFADGLMAGERFYYDVATIGRQLGAAPGLV
jgi:steroid delta-isomerase-like uncharacterized protein